MQYLQVSARTWQFTPVLAERRIGYLNLAFNAWIQQLGRD
jgi:hypothetical protein